jgi:dimethylargininase
MWREREPINQALKPRLSGEVISDSQWSRRRMIALTHLPSPRMERCELTHVARTPIDHGRALRQHQDYCRLLRDCGAEVHTLAVNRDLPDCAFIEDTAVVLDEVAILASMGTASRRPEPAGIEPELRKYRPVRRIELPATLEGGDVLHLGRTLLVGLSSRTNAAGISALEAIVSPHGYAVVPVPVRDCLHLQTACTALDDRRLLVNPAWLDAGALRGFELVRVPQEEPWAANVARVGSPLCIAADHVRTAEVIRGLGFDVRTIDLSEFAKAEGGVTCLSILIQRGSASRG